MEPSAAVCIRSRIGKLVVVTELSLGMTEDQFSDFARRERIVAVVDDAELDLADRLAHRADPVNVVHKKSGRIDHSIDFNDPDTETILEFLPHRGRARRGENYPDFVISIVAARRLLEQNRNHPAQGVELDGVVLAAFVPESRRAEALGDREFRVQQHRSESRDHQRIAMKQRQRRVHRLARVDLDCAQHGDERSCCLRRWRRRLWEARWCPRCTSCSRRRRLSPHRPRVRDRNEPSGHRGSNRRRCLPCRRRPR